MNKEFHDKVALIHVVDKKVLGALNKGSDAWFLPGGHREAGESDEQTLVREIKEELAVDIVPDTIEYEGAFEAQAHGSLPGSAARVTCYTAKFEGVPVASQEIAKISFFAHDRVAEISAPTKLVFDELHRAGLIS
jgi:8-oxo-dGTP pyrophosphatase MutT (NUDIX family)